MLQKLKDTYQYVVDDWNTTGWKIRTVARIHMLNAIICEMTYTYWLFSLPRGWDPSMPTFGPYIGYGRQFRIFCFFVYNVSLFINCGQFFNGLLLYGCVDRGIKEKDGTIETTKFYNIFSCLFIIISGLKFGLLYGYLRCDLLFCLILCVPEVIGLVLGIAVVTHFRVELEHMARIEDKSKYIIGKSGKIIFDTVEKRDFTIPKRFQES